MWLTLLMLMSADPPLTEARRFPPPAVVNVQLGILVERRHWLRGQIAFAPSSPRAGEWAAELRRNTLALDRWEALQEAQGSLGEEEGWLGNESPEAAEREQRKALGRLQRLLDAKDWAAGRIP